MTRITIPGDRRRRLDTQVIAGVEFVDGVADVELGPNKRAYFAAFGYGLEETSTSAGSPIPLHEMTRTQLLADADARGIEITKRNASTDAVRAELEAGITAPAAPEEETSPEPVIEPAVIHTTGQNDDDLAAEHLASADTV
jgi:hypothetical protein